MRTYALGLVLVAGLLGGCKTEAERWRDDVLNARRGEPEAVRGLVVKVTPVKRVYTTDEPVVMQLTVGNASDKDLPVYIELETGVLVTLEIRGEGGFANVSPKINLVRTKDNFAAVSHYVVLPPGYFAGRPIILAANVLRPGKYTLSATYENKFGSCLAKVDFKPDEIQLLQEGALKDGLWTGQALSNLVDFEVVKGKGGKRKGE